MTMSIDTIYKVCLFFKPRWAHSRRWTKWSKCVLGTRSYNSRYVIWKIIRINSNLLKFTGKGFKIFIISVWLVDANKYTTSVSLPKHLQKNLELSINVTVSQCLGVTTFRQDIRSFELMTNDKEWIQSSKINDLSLTRITPILVTSI